MKLDVGNHIHIRSVSHGQGREELSTEAAQSGNCSAEQCIYYRFTAIMDKVKEIPTEAVL